MVEEEAVVAFGSFAVLLELVVFDDFVEEVSVFVVVFEELEDVEELVGAEVLVAELEVEAVEVEGLAVEVDGEGEEGVDDVVLVGVTVLVTLLVLEVSVGFVEVASVEVGVFVEELEGLCVVEVSVVREGDDDPLLTNNVSLDLFFSSVFTSVFVSVFGVDFVVGGVAVPAGASFLPHLVQNLALSAKL